MNVVQKGRGYPAAIPRANMPGYPYSHRMPKKITFNGTFKNGGITETIPFGIDATCTYDPSVPMWRYAAGFSSFFGIYDLFAEGYPDTHTRRDGWWIHLRVVEIAPAPLGSVDVFWLIHPPNDECGVGNWLQGLLPNNVYFGLPLGGPVDFFFSIDPY